jgi:DNA-binding transcriptional LysR family regulator
MVRTIRKRALPDFDHHTTRPQTFHRVRRGLAGRRGGEHHHRASEAIAKHVQLVLTDRSALSEGRNFGVLSPLTWRLADLGAKHAFLKAGLGWGHMPIHMVKADLDSGALVEIRVERMPRDMGLPMKAVYRKDAPPGPAGRAFIAQLKPTQGQLA